MAVTVHENDRYRPVSEAAIGHIEAAREGELFRDAEAVGNGG